MASQFSANRHAAARNTILLWLACAIGLACIGILVTYHALRDETAQTITPAPLLTERNATVSARDRQVMGPSGTDSSADIARAHESAVKSATTPAAAGQAPASTPSEETEAAAGPSN